MAEQKKMVNDITAMDEDFAKWYTDVVKKAELAEYTSVKGCMVIRPYGYAIWENIQRILDGMFKATGPENVCMPMFLGTPRAVCIFIFLGLILIGIAFGCNYTQDMTYGKYMYCYFFKPVKTLRYESTEDIGRIKKKAEELKKEEELLLRKEREADPKAQRKLLIKLLAFVLVLVIAVVSALIYVKAVRPVSYHHEVIEETEVESEQGN